jgi:hypothetical protein
MDPFFFLKQNSPSVVRWCPEDKEGTRKNEAAIVLRTLTSQSGEDVWPGESTSLRRADGTAHF